ncbi:YjbF family lipoprotein [Paracoccaceae bacterium GXU_MW_L88]
MMKPALTFAAIAGLAGCAQIAESLPDSVLERAAEMAGVPVGTESSGGGQLTRAQITEADVAAVRIGFGSPTTVLFAQAAHENYVTYSAPSLQQVTMQGSRVTGTRNLGYDLIWADSTAGDPLDTARPLSSWPDRIGRQYSISGAGVDGDIYDFVCSFQQTGQAGQIEIIERIHNVVEIKETCLGERLSFENTHWADPATGFVWKSRQWVGPQMAPLEVEIVEPLTE